MKSDEEPPVTSEAELSRQARAGDAERGRSETFDEMLDRNWNELLQELRVMQTGVQITTAFLMTLPFQSRFDELGPVQVRFYLVLLAFSVLLAGLNMTPVAIHRRLFRQNIKEITVKQGHRIVQIALVGTGLLVSACVTFIADVLLGDSAALVIGGVVLLAMALLLVVLPVILRRREGYPKD
ncbi:hypothetical protein GCM10023081_43980 [Arthrobacter ginkgonis]|uniref:Sodium:proton antiporter n=1 Tax=Arthrobacter ginkgonis TaxID=1630594 RepID=A0ABP7DDK9_9MICC